jgi:sigma-B regulation protein RsbU (phosphoserine phosphatase)
MIEEIHTSTAPDPQLSVIDKLRMLLDITNKISRSLDLEEILRLVMETLGSLIPYDAAGIYLLDETDGGPPTFRTEMLRGYEIDDLIDPHLKLGEGFIGLVGETGKPILSNDVQTDSRYFAARKRTRAELVAPIISNEEVVGVFDLESDEPDAYTEDDLQVLMLLASQVAIIIEKVKLHEHLAEKKRLQGQLEVARHVQLELLPTDDPQLTGFDISAYNFPTEEVSGDYYDWVRIFEDQIGVVIADASGKGIPAALLMAFLRATLRAAVHIGYAPHISMTKAIFCCGNQLKTINLSRQFTAFWMRLIKHLLSLMLVIILLCCWLKMVQQFLLNVADCRWACFAKHVTTNISYNLNPVKF